MIESLTIKNFKSIKDLSIDCKRVNLFIGRPNTGKSNILEALGLLSWLPYAKVIPEEEKKPDNTKAILIPREYNPRLFNFIRFLGVQDLFRNSLIDEKVEVSVTKQKEIGINMKLMAGAVFIEDKNNNNKIKLSYSGEVTKIDSTLEDFSFIKYYKFSRDNIVFPHDISQSLLPPSGSNLFSLVLGNKRLRKVMADFFKEEELTLVLRPHDMSFEVQSQIGDIVFNNPYISVSDTLQRILFHYMAMESNEENTLVFEEPESYAFPFYTKWLAERIALYNTNQFFISTHNPYFLEPILEKTKKDDINLFAVFKEGFHTKLVKLTEDDISELLDSDPFFNLDQFTERDSE
jgi:AAA15 family ATPase/GTPase